MINFTEQALPGLLRAHKMETLWKQPGTLFPIHTLSQRQLLSELLQLVFQVVYHTPISAGVFKSKEAHSGPPLKWSTD